MSLKNIIDRIAIKDKMIADLQTQIDRLSKKVEWLNGIVDNMDYCAYCGSDGVEHDDIGVGKCRYCDAFYLHDSEANHVTWIDPDEPNIDAVMARTLPKRQLNALYALWNENGHAKH